MIRIRLAALGCAALALLGACAQDEPTVNEPPEETADASPGTDDITVATLGVADSNLGEIVVDAEGMTLYVFMNDTDGKSTCSGTCAETWPPLVVEDDPTAGEGVDESLLGTAERDDGDMQVTYNDKPLYHYAPDEEPGDTGGQGFGGRWHVVSPQGEPIED